MRGECVRDPLFRIEAEFIRDLRPRPPESMSRGRPDERDKFLGHQSEAPFGVDLPDEAERMPPLRKLKRWFGCRLRRRLEVS